MHGEPLPLLRVSMEDAAALSASDGGFESGGVSDSAGGADAGDGSDRHGGVAGGPSKKRQQWTMEEDATLKHLVSVHGEQWNAIARVMPSERTNKQCRDRWSNHCRDGITKGVWTPEEDTVLFLKYRELGARWAEIVHFLPGRTDNSIKNRFHATVRRMRRKDARAARDTADDDAVEEEMMASAACAPAPTEAAVAAAGGCGGARSHLRACGGRPAPPARAADPRSGHAASVLEALLAHGEPPVARPPLAPLLDAQAAGCALDELPLGCEMETAAPASVEGIRDEYSDDCLPPRKRARTA